MERKDIPTLARDGIVAIHQDALRLPDNFIETLFRLDSIRMGVANADDEHIDGRAHCCLDRNAMLVGLLGPQVEETLPFHRRFLPEGVRLVVLNPRKNNAARWRAINVAPIV